MMLCKYCHTSEIGNTGYSFCLLGARDGGVGVSVMMHTGKQDLQKAVYLS